MDPMPTSDIQVAVLSDIHGVLHPLETAHKLLLRDYSPDVVLCAGDVAAFGPEPNESVEFLITNGIMTVSGNTDGYMAHGLPAGLSTTTRGREIMSVMQWSQSQLSTRAKHWLGTLPFSTCIADTLLCLHAGPDSNEQIVDVNDPKPIPDGRAIVCAGHTHHAFVSSSHAGIWGNAGSVSRPTDNDPRGSFLLATRCAKRWTADIIRFDLELEIIFASVRASSMPYQKRWCETQRLAEWW